MINEEMHSTPYQPEELAEDVSHEPPPMIADPVMDNRLSESSTSVRLAEPGSHEDVIVAENANHRNQSRKRLSLKRRHVMEPECTKTTNDSRLQDRLPDMPLSADDLSDLVLLGAARPNQSTDVAANNRTEQSIERNEGDATTLEYKEYRKEQAPRNRLSLKLRRSSITNANLPQEMFSPASTPRETEPLNLLAQPWIENNDANKTTDAANVLLQLAAGISTTCDTSENTSSISSTGTDQQCETAGPDPEMLLPGGTGSRSLEPSGESREGGGGECERGLNPPLIRGSGASPGKFCKIYVSENTFQAILKPIFPYSITSI